jgi:1-deoxy-D-xylulose-5-phosphate synthase
VSVLLIGFGATVQTVQDAADLLYKEHGIDATVVNARFAKPLDEELLMEIVPEHSLVVTVEDHVIMGGFGSAVLEFLADSGLSAGRIVMRLGIEDHFVEHGTQSELYRICGYDRDSVVARVSEAVRKFRAEVSDRPTGQTRISQVG